MTLSKNNFHHRVASIFDLIDRETTARIDATNSSSLQGLQISYQPKERLLILRCLNPCLIHSWPSFSRSVWKTVWSKQLNCSNQRWWAKLDWVKKRSRRCNCSLTACFVRDGDDRTLYLLQVPPADFVKWRCAPEEHHHRQPEEDKGWGLREAALNADLQVPLWCSITTKEQLCRWSDSPKVQLHFLSVSLEQCKVLTYCSPLGMIQVQLNKIKRNSKVFHELKTKDYAGLRNFDSR